MEIFSFLMGSSSESSELDSDALLAHDPVQLGRNFGPSERGCVEEKAPNSRRAAKALHAQTIDTDIRLLAEDHGKKSLPYLHLGNSMAALSSSLNSSSPSRHHL